MPKKPSKAKAYKPKTEAKHDKDKTSWQQGYNARHFALRNQCLALNPICVACFADWSYHAHHKVYPALTVDDYVALCSKCHHKEHRG